MESKRRNNLPRKKRYSRQQCKKRFDKECFVCKESNYDVLDAHRIVEQGSYITENILTLCSNCHRKTHTGDFVFEKKYLSTKGCYVLHWWKNGEELWTEC